MTQDGPDAGGDAGGGKAPRRRGSRGGRGRVRGAAKETGAEEGVVKPKAKRAASVRRKAPAKIVGNAEAQQPVEAAPVAEAPVVTSESPSAPVVEGGAEQGGSQQTGGTGAGFVPGPPRVGMRPAVIRPAGPGRMSFSTEKQRHQFRPSGGGAASGFRPPRPFTPPAVAGDAGVSATGTPGSAFTAGPPLDDQDILDSEGPQPGNMISPPRPIQPVQGGNRHGQQRGPQQQGRGGPQRHDQRGRQQGPGRGNPQGGGGQPRQGNQQHGPVRGPQQHVQRHPGNQGQQVPPRGVQPQPQGGGRIAQQPIARPIIQRPVESVQAALPAIEQLPVNEGNFVSEGGVGNEIVQLPATAAAGGDSIAGGTGAGALAPMTPAETAALAPFAEDIEIDESLSQMPAKRRELTGRDMLINVVEGEEIRIAVVRRGQLEELYMERSSSESHIGNIYKGRVTNVEPSIQAAFIDFGIGKNGFLHISDLHPQYFPKKMQPRMPQHRGGRGPVKAVAPSAAPAAGFHPPTETAAPAASEGPVAEHAVAEDAPAVAFDRPAGDEAPILPVNEAGQVAEVPSENASVEASVRANDTVNTEANSEAAPDVDGEEAAAAEERQEERADFGSAYNTEFSDEEEDFDGYGGLDDGHMKPMEKVGRKTPRYERPPIQQCLRRGQEVIVQVTKEGIGTKGPTLTSYISCPGRYLVMMPGMAQLGVSRKIEDLEQRRELKRTLQELNPPKNLGFIIRTAGTDVSKKELQGDLNYLVRMWKVIANRIRNHRAPVELYQESDLVIRTIRDVFNDDIDRIVVDNEQVASRIRDFLSIVDPRSAGIVELYTGTMPLYQKFGVEREIEKINSRRVEMANGGSLVIDSTEALVAIDVNSGRYREQRDAELTAFNVNKEAVKEVVRQLRLRDLGGVIVIDFIDMREERHKRDIEALLRKEMESDRAKTKVLRMSLFCMIEMTRQRVRPSLKRSIYMDCPHCHGSALIKTPESVSLDVMRRLAAGATRVDVTKIDVRAYPTVATFLLNRKRKQLVELEEKTGKRITVLPDNTLAGDQIVLDARNAADNVLNIVL